MRVLVFGDSISQGFWDTEGGWVQRIRKHYDELLVRNNDSNQPTVFNLGVSGDFTSSVLKRFKHEVEARIWPGEEFTFIFSIGMNDSVYRDDEHDSEPEIYAEQLTQLLKLAKQFTSRTLFVSLFPAVDKLVQPLQWSTSGKCYSTERIKLFEDELEEFCRTNKAPLADIWTPLSKTNNLESLLPDGVHPNNEGHELIANLVLPELEKLLAN